MGKVEQDGRIEEFKNAMNSRNYDEAVQIADTLDIKHIRDNNLLGLIADAYELSKDYELAKQVLLYAYENTKAGRHLAYRLCLVSIKNGELDEAEEFYEDFYEMAPKDSGRYVLQYKMAEAKNEPKDKLIKILEEYVNIDMEEKWAYELAKLYKETGDTKKCVELCDEMGLWFSEGRYIKKAMELKKSIQPLNITQQQLLDNDVPDETEEKPKSEPHVSKSPIESIMEKQPDRKPYVDPDEPKEEIKEEPLFGFESSESEKPKTFKPDLDKPLGESSFESGVQNFDLFKDRETESAPTVTQDEYKPSFDITEIKVADEPKIKPESILTAQPVEDGPQQMSFFNDDSPSNNKYEADEPKMSFEKPSFLKDAPDFSEPEQKEEKLPDVKDVEDILKKLQERGILGADTVDKAVNAINSDTHQIEEELKEEVDSILAEQEEEEVPVEETPAEEPEVDDYEKPQTGYTREEPEEIKPIVPEMAENYSDDDEVADRIIQGKDFTETDIPEFDIDAGDKSDTTQIEDINNENEESMVDQVPVEMGEIDDMESFEAPEKNLGNTKEVGNVLKKPTEIIPNKNELEQESKKPYQAAKVLDEAVPPTSDESKDVPVFDLSGEYTTQDNNEPEVTEQAETQETSEPKINVEDKLEPEPVVKEVLKESNESSAKVEMISGEEPDNKKLEPVEKTEEPKEQPKEDLGNTKQVNLPTRRELKQKARKEKKKDLNTERVKFNVEDSDMTVFGNYLNVEGLEGTVKKVCNDLIKRFIGEEKDTKTNVIVMGDEKTGKTTMAIEIIKLVNKKSERRNRKVAKISADTLNKKSFTKVLAKIQGCDLIVENAQNIHTTTIQEMVNALAPNNTDSIIILEAETEPMEELLASAPSLVKTFEHVIKIKKYNIREWVEYGSEYAKTQGYKLDEVAELALFKSIDDAFGAHKGISKLDVEEIIDKAITRSERFGKRIFGSKKDEDGLKLLDESDFNISL